MMVHLFLFET